MFRRTVVLAAVVALLLSGAQPAHASSPRTKTTVHDYHTFAPIEGATATLTRTTDGLTATLKTTLPAGNAETMWWVLFQNIPACTSDGGGCSEDDVLAVFATGKNPAKIAVLNADGRVVPPPGGVTFASRLNVGSEGPGQNLIAGGLTDALGALVLLVIVDHGPAAADQETRYLQTHALTWPGACPNQTAADPFGDCADSQVAVFPPM